MIAKLHVISGSLRGRLLKTPKSSSTRPTTALLRKSFFDVVKTVIEGANFLDLFAGSGAIGIEALSRGAAHATFVETHKEAIRCIRDNISTFHLESQATLLPYDVRLALKKLHKQGQTFDLIYADPPYTHTDLYAELLSFFDQGHLLHPGSLLFIEEGSPPSLHPQSLPHLTYKTTRHFGKSLLHQYVYY
jgi:16S rRNA (guanine966-N2)-methyltransferase